MKLGILIFGSTGIAVGVFIILYGLSFSSSSTAQPQERFLMGMEEDMVASHFYYDQEDYFEEELMAVMESLINR